MPRTLRDLAPDDRERVVSEVHAEAQAAGWHALNNTQRAELYQQWERRYGLSHAALKDRVMKGFDAAQGIPRRSEALVQDELEALFRRAGLYVQRSLGVWTGRERADFVLGYTQHFPTHVIEVENAQSWAEGLRQALWYRAAMRTQRNREVIPSLILFGDVTAERFQQIIDTCVDNHVQLWTYRFRVDGEADPDYAITNHLPTAPLFR